MIFCKLHFLAILDLVEQHLIYNESRFFYSGGTQTLLQGTTAKLTNVSVLLMPFFSSCFVTREASFHMHIE